MERHTSKRYLDDEHEDDVLDEDSEPAAKVVNGTAVPLEPVPGEMAAKARKNLRRDVEGKLAESSRRFLTAFAEVDKVCHNAFMFVR